MTFEAPRNCTFATRLDCHYLLYVPAAVSARTLLVVALHGYGSNPKTMLRLAGSAFGPDHAVAALEGPNAFFLPGDAQEVGFGWITHRHAPSAVRLHHEMVLHVLHEAGREYGIPPERRLIAGFSQAVGLNYRFAATHPDAVRGVLAVCGGLPGDWEQGQYERVRASVLHIARREDEYYPPAATEQYVERLRVRAADVEFHLLEGGHRFPSKAAPLVQSWVERILR